MKSDNSNEAGNLFSLEELPSDYPYRYTLHYILRNKLTLPEQKRVIRNAMERMDIGERMFNNYRYVRADDTQYELTDERLEVLAAEIGINKDLLIAHPTIVKG